VNPSRFWAIWCCAAAAVMAISAGINMFVR
jgi:hypothetical protein